MRLKKIFTIGLLLFSFIIVTSCKKAEIKVAVTQEKLEVYVNESVDYKEYFTIFEGEIEIAITDDLIDASNVDLSKVGNYQVVLTYKKNSATLKVDVKDKVEISKTNANNVMELNGSLDYKTLFTLKVNGEDVAVVDSMIDSSQVNKAQAGTYEVTLNYKLNDVDYSLKAQVIVNAPDVIIVSVNNANPVVKLGDTIDYISYFSITKNGVNVPVILDMIDTSSVKEEAGVYTVTLTYLGESRSVTLRIIDPTDELEAAFQLLNYNYTLKFSGEYTNEYSLKLIEKGCEIAVSHEDEKIYYVYDGNLNQTYLIEKVADSWIKNTVSNNEIDFYLETFEYIDISMLYYSNGKYLVDEEFLDDVLNVLIGKNDLTATNIEFIIREEAIAEILVKTSTGTIKVEVKDLNSVQINVPEATMEDIANRLPELKSYEGVGQTTEDALTAALEANYVNNVTANIKVNWMNSDQEQNVLIKSTTNNNTSGETRSELDSTIFSYKFDSKANAFLVQYMDVLTNEHGYDFYTVDEMSSYGLKFDFSKINGINKQYFSVSDDYYVAKSIDLFSGPFNRFFKEILMFYINEDYTQYSEEFFIDDFAMKIQDNKISYVAGRLRYETENSIEYYTVQIEFTHGVETTDDIDLDKISSLDRLVANLQLNPEYSLNYQYVENGNTHSILIHYYESYIVYEYETEKYAVSIEPFYWGDYYLGDIICLYKSVNNFWVDQEAELENISDINQLNMPVVNFSYLIKSDGGTSYLSDLFKNNENVYTTESYDVVKAIFGDVIGLNSVNGVLSSTGIDENLVQNLKITIDETKIVSIELTLTTGVLTLTLGTVGNYPLPADGNNIYGKLHDLGVEGVGSQDVNDLNIAVQNLGSYKFTEALAIYADDKYQRDTYEYYIGEKGVYNPYDDFYYEYLAKYNTYFGYSVGYEMFDYYTKSELKEYEVYLEPLNLAVLDKANFKSSEDGYFRGLTDAHTKGLVQELFGDLSAGGKYMATIKDFVVKVVDQKLMYIGLELSRTNGTKIEDYVLEYFFSEHDEFDLKEYEEICVQSVTDYPLEPAIIKLTDYIFKVELTVTYNGVSEKIVMAYSENYTLYTFEDGTQIYVEYFGDYYDVYTLVDGKWKVEEVEDISTIGLPEIYYISHFLPNGDSYAYIRDYFALNAQGEYACESSNSFYFALYFMLLYTVFDNELIEFSNTDVTKFAYILNDNYFLDEILMEAKGYTLSYKFFDSTKFNLPSLIDVPNIEDDNPSVGSEDIIDLNLAIENGFNNYKVNHSYAIINPDGSKFSETTTFYTDGNKTIMEFVGMDDLTYKSYYLYKGDYIVDQYDKDENGNWIVSKDQDITMALAYGLIPYFTYDVLAKYSFDAKEGYFTTNNAIEVFCDMYGYNVDLFKIAHDFRIKVVGQRIVKIIAVMEANDGSMLVYNITLDEYDEMQVSLPNDLDIAYKDLALSEKYASNVSIEFNGVTENVEIKYDNNLYQIIFSDGSEAFYDAIKKETHIFMFGQWFVSELGGKTLAEELGTTILFLIDTFTEGFIDPVELLMSEIFTVSEGNENLYVCKKEQLMYVGDCLLSNGLGFDYGSVNHFVLNYQEITMELKDGTLSEIIIRIGDYVIIVKYDSFSGEVVLPGENEEPIEPETPVVELDTLVAGMLTTASQTNYTSYALEILLDGELFANYEFYNNIIKIDDPYYGLTYIEYFENNSKIYTENNGVWSFEEKSNTTLAMQYFLGFDITLFDETDYVIEDKYFVSTEEGYEKIATHFSAFWSYATQIKVGLIDGKIAQYILVDNYGTLTFNYTKINETTVELPTVA